MNKANKIEIRVTADELEAIDKKAAAAELKRSQYVRKMAIEGYIIKRDFSEVERLVYEVNKIGNNINQMARKVNETDYIRLDDIKHLRKRLDDIYESIGTFYDER